MSIAVDPIRKHLARQARELLGFQASSSAQFQRLLEDLQARLSGRLAAIGDDGNVFDVTRLRRVEAETRVVIEAIKAQTSKLYTGSVDAAVDLAIGHFGDEWNFVAKAIGEQAFPVSQLAPRVFADPLHELLAEQFQTSLDRYGMDALNAARREMFIGLRMGDDMRDVTKRVRDTVGDLSKSQGERLVRTEVAEAYGVAKQGAMQSAQKKVGPLKKVWIHNGSYPCPTCMPLHGTMRDMDGTWTIRSGKKTRKVAHSPAHPNCVCTTTAMTPAMRQRLIDKKILVPESADEQGKS